MRRNVVRFRNFQKKASSAEAVAFFYVSTGKWNLPPTSKCHHGSLVECPWHLFFFFFCTVIKLGQNGVEWTGKAKGRKGSFLASRRSTQSYLLT